MSRIAPHSRLERTAVWAGLALVAAAVGNELRKDPADRTWHGELFGFLPYDLRPRTPGRIRRRWWNPDDRRLLTPQVFGVGWSINLARLCGCRQ